MPRKTWHFPLDGRTTYVSVAGTTVTVQGSSIFALSAPEGLSFKLEGSLWPSIGIEKRLFIDGVDIETGKRFETPSAAGRAVFFTLGLLFGLVILLPLLIWIGVCCVMNRNRVVALYRIPDLPSKSSSYLPAGSSADSSEKTGLLGKLLGKK